MFAIGTEVSSLEGGVLTLNQSLRFELRVLLLLEMVLPGTSVAPRSRSPGIKSFMEVFMKDANVNTWAKYNFGNYIYLLYLSVVMS